jgi:hypothetical protein
MGPELAYEALDVTRARETRSASAPTPVRHAGVRLFADARAELHGTSLPTG